MEFLEDGVKRRNPYFSGFSLAIGSKVRVKRLTLGRNPYFSGFSLAIRAEKTSEKANLDGRNPYFSGFSLAIGNTQFRPWISKSSQSLF